MNQTNITFYPFRKGAIIPTKGTATAAGYDLAACMENFITIVPGATAVIPTGLNVHIESGYELQCRSRSGLAAKQSISVLNSPGTIDEDYTGIGPDFEIKVILHNSSRVPFFVNPGDRVAQLVLNQLPKTTVTVSPNEKEFLQLISSAKSDRVGGLGSTGVKSQ